MTENPQYNSQTLDGPVNASASTILARCVWGIAAILLLGAAFLKGYEMATQPSVSGHLEHRGWLVALVEAEGLLGLWMILGPWRYAAWYIPTGAFTCFAGATAYKIATGATDCGCFGLIRINPSITFVIDLGMTVGLWYSRTAWAAPHAHIIIVPRLRWLPLSIIAICLGVPGGWKMIALSARNLDDDELMTIDGSLVVLEPAKWVGKRQPLGRYLDIGQELEHGEWIMVLYHSECHVCQQAVPNFVRLASTMRQEKSNAHVALIEMPPYASASQALVQSQTNVWKGRLLETHEWFAITPIVLVVSEGIVTQATEGDSALQTSRKLLTNMQVFPPVVAAEAGK